MEALIKLFLRCYVWRNPDVRAWHIPVDDGCIIITVHKRKECWKGKRNLECKGKECRFYGSDTCYAKDGDHHEG